MRRLSRSVITMLFAAVPLAAAAQGFPSKPVTILVPFPPGGTTDVLARAVAQRLNEAWKQPVLVENRAGAGATLGAAQAARAPADGYTLLMGAVHHTIATSLYPKLPYDFEKSFAPITIVANVPNVLAINPSLPVRTVAELVQFGKANPGKLTYGSNGQGTAQHLIGEQFSSRTGVAMLHVPYKGSGPLVADLVAGQVSMSFDTITPVLSHIRAGKLRALAVTTAKRSGALPDLPTLAEAGVSGFDQGTWFGLLAPAGTPAPVLQKIGQDVVAILKSADFEKRLAEIGAEVVANTPAQMAATIRADTERYAEIAKRANVKVE